MRFSHKQIKPYEIPSIGYQNQEVFGVGDNGQKTWQYNTQAAVDGAKKFSAEIALKAPNPVIETTGRVIE